MNDYEDEKYVVKLPQRENFRVFPSWKSSW